MLQQNYERLKPDDPDKSFELRGRVDFEYAAALVCTKRLESVEMEELAVEAVGRVIDSRRIVTPPEELMKSIVARYAVKKGSRPVPLAAVLDERFEPDIEKICMKEGTNTSAIVTEGVGRLLESRAKIIQPKLQRALDANPRNQVIIKAIMTFRQIDKLIMSDVTRELNYYYQPSWKKNL